MRVTDNLIKRLEEIQFKLCISSYKNSDNPLSPNINHIYVIVGWKIEDKKDLWGHKYKKLTEIWIKNEMNFGKNYIGVITSNIEFRLKRSEYDRQNFLTIKEELEKIGFEIVKKEKKDE